MSTPYTELLNIRDFIRFAASQFNASGLFYGHGTDNAWDEASALVLHTLHLPHDIPTAVLDARLLPDEKSRLYQLIMQRVEKRIPLPYITHEAWFAGLSFYVDERVLIPRSSIAELIENEFEPWINPAEVVDILDLCTGSACIAIACAKQFNEAHIDASDLSENALAVANINVLRHKLENQITLYHSDLFINLPKKQYDVIICNPPYVDAEDMADLPPEYTHEPTVALAAGADGLNIIKRILSDAKKYLKPNGILIVEVGNSAAALAAQFPALNFTWLEFERGDTGVFMLTADQL